MRLALAGTARLDAGDVQQAGRECNQIIGEIVHHGADLEYRILSRCAHGRIGAVDDLRLRVNPIRDGHSGEEFGQGQQCNAVGRHGAVLSTERLGQEHDGDLFSNASDKHIDVFLERECQRRVEDRMHRNDIMAGGYPMLRLLNAFFRGDIKEFGSIENVGCDTELFDFILPNCRAETKE